MSTTGNEVMPILVNHMALTFYLTSILTANVLRIGAKKMIVPTSRYTGIAMGAPAMPQQGIGNMFEPISGDVVARRKKPYSGICSRFIRVTYITHLH